MGEANENRNRSREMLNLSLQLEKYPRDLLQKFMHPGGSQQSHEEDTPTSPSEEIELNLGLSLGGRFGVDKNAKKKLYRSSSIAGPIPISREIDRTITPPVTATTATTNSSTSSSQPMGYQSLVRTSSLPTETEEEWRKRKELQTLRRMAAKRRRNEKQRNASVNSQKADKTEFNLEEERQNRIPLGMKSCGTAGRKAAGSGGTGGGFFQGLGQPSSQGSMESQGGGSSGMSELESKHVQGSSSGSGGEARSSANIQTSQDRSHQEIAASSRTKTNENTSKTAKQEMDDVAKKLERRNSRGSGMNLLEDMPCVFTDGPNGRRIEGILYKYGKGEEVRIMCVCHGSFLSPFEFVKHAGHRDVDNPLRHIVVNPSAAPLS